MKRTRRKIDSALKVKIVFEALRRQKPIAELAQQYGVHPNQIYSWKGQLEHYSIFAFDHRPCVLSAPRRTRSASSSLPPISQDEGR
jgi:transposase-like protein